MPEKILKYMDILFGSTGRFSMEHRVFLVANFLGIMLGVLNGVTELLLGLAPYFYFYSLFATCSFSFLYYRARVSDSFHVLVLPWLSILFITIIYDWLLMGGVTGIAPLFVLVVSISVSLVLHGREKILAFAALLIIIATLFAFDLYFHDMLVKYQNAVSHQNDIISTMISLMLAIFIFTSVIIQSHQAETGRFKDANDDLQEINRQLHETLAEVKDLRGLLPICSFCKKIRDSKGYWKQVEEYISDRSDAEFSHGFCEECGRKHYPEYFQDKKDS